MNVRLFQTVLSLTLALLGGFGPVRYSYVHMGHHRGYARGTGFARSGSRVEDSHHDEPTAAVREFEHAYAALLGRAPVQITPVTAALPAAQLHVPRLEFQSRLFTADDPAVLSRFVGMPSGRAPPSWS